MHLVPEGQGQGQACLATRQRQLVVKGVFYFFSQIETKTGPGTGGQRSEVKQEIATYLKRGNEASPPADGPGTP